MRPARKATRDAARTKKKIISEAMNEFAAKGYDGARVDSIASRCKLSKNMLYHYFGSKEGLFTAVLKCMYVSLRAKQQDFSIRRDEPIEAMRRLIAYTFQAFVDNPETIRLLNDENKHKGRHIRRLRRLRELYDPLVGTLRELVRRGHAEGVFRADIDPVTLYISLSSLAYHYLSNQYTLHVALGIDLASKAARRRWLAHVTDMIITYCCREPYDAQRRRGRR